MNKFVITEIHQFLKVGEEAVKFYEDLYFVEDSPGAAYRKFQAHLKQQYGEDRHVSVSANRQLNPGPDMFEKTEELINQYNAKQSRKMVTMKQYETKTTTLLPQIHLEDVSNHFCLHVEMLFWWMLLQTWIELTKNYSTW